MTGKVKCAIIGSGNIGADLMIKVMRTSDVLEMGAMVGIDPDSDGLARAKKLGVATTHEGMDGLVKISRWCSMRPRRRRMHITMSSASATASEWWI